VEIERIASIPIRLSNSEGICASNLAARCARALRRRPLKEGGRRESRVRAAPAVPCALLLGKMHTSIQVSGGIPAFPARWFTAYSALSRVTGLSCHPHPRASFASRELDASVGAPGPHGFNVRNERHSSFAAAASTASHRTFVTIASRPSHRVRRVWIYADL
jgi:hypothetical protein